MIRIELKGHFHDVAGDPCEVIVFLLQGGTVLRESTINAVERMQKAIDSLPAAGGSTGGTGATDSGVTDADLDNLDATLNDQAGQIEAKAAPASSGQ